MGGVKALFKGPPKPKRDKSAERLQAKLLAQEKEREEDQEARLAAARRARMGGSGYGRTLLAYTGPKQPGSKSTKTGA